MAVKKSKSRLASTAKKKGGIKFRWWMAVILVVIVAGIGIAVLRFSQAGSGMIVTRHGTTNNMVSNGSFIQGQETYGQIVGNYNLSNIDRADIQVCWSLMRIPASATYTLEVLNWGGSQAAVLPSYPNNQACIQATVSSPDPNYNFFYKVVGTNGGNVQYNGVSRRTLRVYPKTQSYTPAPSNPAPSQNPNVQTLQFPAGNLTTICGYSNEKGFASVCPQNADQWQYIGLNSRWVGTWEQNRAKGVGHEHDVGYWKWGNFCGVKSHVVGDPLLPYSPGSPIHFYLVNCPTTQEYLQVKQDRQSWTRR